MDGRFQNFLKFDRGDTYGHIGANGIDLRELGFEKRVQLGLPHFSAEKIVYEHFHLIQR